MTTRSPFRGRRAELMGRREERKVLDRLIEAVRTGESRALVVRGEPGVGKTALLDYVAEQATNCRVVRATGVQSEMELVFAALHHLLTPLLDRLERLPLPQREALRTAFGLTSGPAPDRFLIGLAVLGLLSEEAEKQPLICLVDDEQWLDRASAQALAFVARRLDAEAVGLIFAGRTPSDDVAGLPELLVDGLRAHDAGTLLDSVLTAPLDPQARDCILAETNGNPLALTELPRGLTSVELAGGFALPDAVPLSGSIEASFQRRLDALPSETQCLLQLAAADPVGDPLLVWRAAERLGIPADAATPAVQAGLIEFGARVRFHHPLVRSAAYRSATLQERQAVHRALAEVTDPEFDPDRRAWHRAHAAPGPDEDVADELELAADRAQARGGLAAAAAFLEHSSLLTREPVRRTRRLLAAAEGKHRAGAPDAALGLLAMAAAGPLDEVQRARVDLLRGHVAFTSRRGRDAPPLLLEAAKRLEPLDAGLARETYLDSFSAVMFAGRLANPGGGVPEVSRAAHAAPPPLHQPRSADLLLDGLAAHFCDGYSAGVPILQRALGSFGNDVSAREALRWLWLACVAAIHLWDDESWDGLSSNYVQLARDAGALSELPLALSSRIYVRLFAGELTAVKAMLDELQAAVEATGTDLAPYGALGLAAWRGREAAASELIETSRKEATARGEGIGVTVSEWASAVLHNGLGRYDEAFAAARNATDYPLDLGSANWSLVELVEAAVRSGERDTAVTAHSRLREMTDVITTDWARGLEARCLAMLSDGEDADRLYRDSIERLGRSRVRVELARAHLLYGEWLRRENRRLDAREQLRTAHAMFASMGTEAFADRARRELMATGESVRKRVEETRRELTAQEAQIARLARDGLSNPEIGTRLFISSRTVQYHLSKVFTKLGVSSRSQLDRALPSDPPTDH